MAKYRSHSIEFKRQVTQEYLAGETLHGLAKRHDICPGCQTASRLLGSRSSNTAEPRHRGGGVHPEDPYEDVYQAAVALTVAAHVVPFWESSPNHAQVFRGSNNHEYAAVPWIFRDRSEEESRQAWERLAILVARLRVARPELSEERAVALVQH